MKKTLFSTILFLFCAIVLGRVTPAVAQDTPTNYQDSVKMNYVPTLEEALKLSKETGKPIFVNCYAHWAQPCQGMDKLVFSDADFGEWMNQHFVNLWLDVVATQEGRDFAEKYGVKRFAHYVVLDANGNLIHRIVGGAPVEAFKEKLQKVVDGNTLVAMDKRFEEGERDMDFLRTYLSVISDSDNSDKYEEVVKIFMSKLPKEEWSKDENWPIIATRIQSTDSDMFHYVEDNLNLFLKGEKEQNVKNKAYSLFYLELSPYFSAITEYDDAFFKKMKARIDKFQFDEGSDIQELYDISVVRSKNDYPAFLNELRETSEVVHPRTLDIINYSLEGYKKLDKPQRQPFIDYLKEFSATHEGYENRYDDIIHTLETYNGLKFFEGSLAEAKAKAKAEDKLIFIDAFATWCGPCKSMDRNVFPQREVGDYMNAKFVNLKLDAERGEGLDVAKNYGVAAFPSFLILDADGKLVHRFTGGRDAKNFVDQVARAFDPQKSYVAAKERYLDGDKSPEAHANYLIALHNNGELPRAASVANEYLTSLPIADRTNPAAWELFQTVIMNPALKSFQDFSKNFEAFAKVVGKEEADDKLKSIIIPLLVSEATGDAKVEEKEANRAAINLVNVPEDHMIALARKALLLKDKADYDGIIKLYTDIVRHSDSLKDRVQMDSYTFSLFKNAPREAQIKIAAYLKEAKDEVEGKNQKMYGDLIRIFDIREGEQHH